MANKIYAATALTGGGTGALDKINGQILADGDGAIVIDASNNILYVYTLNASGSDAESSPAIIVPDSNAGSAPNQKQWDLVAVHIGDTSLTDNRLIKADGTDGKLQDTGITVDDSDNVSGMGTLGCGAITGSGTITITGLATLNGDLKLDSAGGLLEHNQNTPAGTAVMGYNGHFYATKVFNPVYQDLAERFLVDPKSVYQPGKCYAMQKDGLIHITMEKLQKGCVGIMSDTFGMCIGGDEQVVGRKAKWAEIALCGRVLAQVETDEELEPGTPLTCSKWGVLVPMTPKEVRYFPERVVAIYLYKEPNKAWGPEGAKIDVAGRHWVKVR